MTKKFLSLALLLVLLGTLAACGQEDITAGKAETAPQLAKVVSEYAANEAGVAITAEFDKNGKLLSDFDEETWAARGTLLKNSGYDEAGNLLWYAEYTDVTDKKTGQLKHVAFVYNAEGELQNQIPAE